MNDVFDVYKRIATSNGSNEREQILTDLKDSYEDYLDHTLTACKFTIDSVAYDVSIQDVNDQNNKDLRDDKYLICSMTTPIKVGDIGLWDKYNEYFVVIKDEKKTVESNKRFKIYPCNYLLKWVDLKAKADRESYCVVEDATMYTDGIKEETIIKYQDQMIKLTIPTIVEINKFDEDQRLCVDGKFYIITSVNRLTKGITRIVAVSTLMSENDNLELGIADYHKIDRTPVPPILTTKDITIVGKQMLYIGQVGNYKASVTNDLGDSLPDIVTWSISGNGVISSFSGNDIVIKTNTVPSAKIHLIASLDSGLFTKEFIIDVRRL